MSFSRKEETGMGAERPTEQHPQASAIVLVKVLALCFPFKILSGI